MTYTHNYRGNNGKPVLVTGSCGLIGVALLDMLQKQGISVKGFDILETGPAFGDIRDADAVEQAVRGCSGVVHLAAISRVIYGEMNPELCQDVNLKGIHNVIHAILRQKERPWLIFSSSREVYGNVPVLPVSETQPLAPINLYGETKAQSEVAVTEAVRSEGLQAAILRFSNVFGGTNDYHDRVVPAFILAALAGSPLRVDGGENTFDFTYLNEVLRGILMTMKFLWHQEISLEPVHFVTGRPTTLLELAHMILDLTSSHSDIVMANPRQYDVGRFYGSPERAERILGWRHETALETGLLNLISALKEKKFSHLEMNHVRMLIACE